MLQITPYGPSNSSKAGAALAQVGMFRRKSIGKIAHIGITLPVDVHIAHCPGVEGIKGSAGIAVYILNIQRPLCLRPVSHCSLAHNSGAAVSWKNLRQYIDVMIAAGIDDANIQRINVISRIIRKLQVQVGHPHGKN